MALTPAEKQKRYRDREREKLALLRKAAAGHVTTPSDIKTEFTEHIGISLCISATTGALMTELGYMAESAHVVLRVKACINNMNATGGVAGYAEVDLRALKKSIAELESNIKKARNVTK